MDSWSIQGVEEKEKIYKYYLYGSKVKGCIKILMLTWEGENFQCNQRQERGREEGVIEKSRS